MSPSRGSAKFDGREPRRLSPAEIAQIAGRAGRHMSDGTFGTTAELDGIDAEVVEAVENHRFDPLPRLFWRNARLDFRSPEALLNSLEMRPKQPGLVLAREADDFLALRALAKSPDIAERATDRARVRLLWEVCQIPDFRKVMSDTHARLLAQIYRHLTGPEERLPLDWVADQMTRLDRSDGDIDTLMTRIAHIRTWTYISHRPDWVVDAAQSQERARAIEDRLSDALHDRITQRFVDRRSAFLVRQLAASGELLASVSEAGEVKVEGHYVGRLDGFRFLPDAAASDDETRTLLTAANRVLRGEIAARAQRLAASGDAEFALGPDGALRWRGGEVGRLRAGETALGPRIEVLPGDFLEGKLRETVRQRLARFVEAALGHGLAALYRAREAELPGPARGLVFQLAEALGSLPAPELAPLRAALGPADRKALARLGVRLGAETVYLAPLLKPPAAALRGLLMGGAAGRAHPCGSSRYGGDGAIPRSGPRPTRRWATACSGRAYSALIGSSFWRWRRGVSRARAPSPPRRNWRRSPAASSRSWRRCCKPWVTAPSPTTTARSPSMRAPRRRAARKSGGRGTSRRGAGRRRPMVPSPSCASCGSSDERACRLEPAPRQMAVVRAARPHALACRANSASTAA